jgi:hypothetical protein
MVGSEDGKYGMEVQGKFQFIGASATPNCLGNGSNERFLQELPGLRQIAGCPKGADEALLRLSRPPFYTAFPNPFLKDFLSSKVVPPIRDGFHDSVSAFSVDVSKGRSGPIYDAHSYPTKVPPEAIAQYILHYTEPGDVILDGFCGTGMTGVAAQMCSIPPADLRRVMEQRGQPVKWGLRRAILTDLSPFATFIAANLNLEVDPDRFEQEASNILHEAETLIGWAYKTPHHESFGEIQYVIWSEIFCCPSCSENFDFWSAAVDLRTGTIYDRFECPHCRRSLTKNEAIRVTEAAFDPFLCHTVKMIISRPLL